MALNATQLLEGINGAEFTQEEWDNAMKYLKLNVQLGIKQSQIANLQTAMGAYTAEYQTTLGTFQAEQAAIVEAINALAP